MQNELWNVEISHLLAEIITRANFNRLPQSFDDWSLIAERFCLDLSLERVPSRHAGILMEDVIVVRWHPVPAVTYRRIAHEIAEYLLKSEWEAPYCIPAYDMQQQRHQMARNVEALLVAEARQRN